MGTRSLTRIIEDNKPLLCMYRQYDGYPSGQGAELAEFLLGLHMVNGMSGDTTRVANGAGCLAAQLVAHFKTELGGICIYPANTKNAGQDYEYDINVKFGSPGIEIICWDISFYYPNGHDHAGCRKRKKLFSGDAAALQAFCKPEKE